jgi:hypothetical protein
MPSRLVSSRRLVTEILVGVTTIGIEEEIEGQEQVMRTGGGGGVCLLASPVLRVSACLGPWDDWRAELNQPSGDDIGSRRCADMQFSRNSSIPLVRILDRVDEQTNHSCGTLRLCASDMEIGRQASRPGSNVILPELLPSEVETWTNEPPSACRLDKA